MRVPLHGLGGAQDLPIPLSLAVAGGAAALIVSFCVLALAWTAPRYEPVGPGRRFRRLDVVDSAAFAWALRLLGLLFFGWTAIALLWGPDVAVNPALRVFYVLVWVGLVPLSLAFGPVVKAVSPVRTLHRLLSLVTRSDPARGVVEYPEKLGYWPAALGLFAFVWQELVNPDQVYLDSVRLWLALYAAVLVIGAAVFGDTWFARADPFEVYSSLLAKLSPWGRDTDGRLVVRSPLANLATTEARPGLVAVIAVLLGSTAFDSFRDSLTWARFSQGGFNDWSGLEVGTTTLNLVGLLLGCLLVGVTFTVAARLTALEHVDVKHRDLPRLLAHSLVPIIVGYMVAHYLTYLVEQGQVAIQQLSDPLVRGDDYLGTAGLQVSYWLSDNAAFLAVLKVLAVVVGHLLGVVAAHDRALKLLPRTHNVIGQLAMLVVMVGYTTGGLWLLFSS